MFKIYKVEAKIFLKGKFEILQNDSWMNISNFVKKIELSNK